MLVLGSALSADAHYAQSTISSKDAQAAINRYVHIVGIGTDPFIHGYIFDKTALVNVLQRFHCDGVRIYNTRNKDRENGFAFWPLDNDDHNMNVKSVPMQTVDDQCPGNCDFTFMADIRYMPHRAQRSAYYDIDAVNEQVKRYAHSKRRPPVRSFVLQKDQLLLALINNSECRYIRIYFGMEKDHETRCLIIAGADAYGNTEWNLPLVYSSEENICEGNCF